MNNALSRDRRAVSSCRILSAASPSVVIGPSAVHWDISALHGDVARRDVGAAAVPVIVVARNRADHG